MINACAKAGDVHKAEKWLHRMLQDGIEPNAITFNAVIVACAKNGQGRLAENWLEKMRHANVPPNSFSYNSAAKPFVASGDYCKVEQLMHDLKNDGELLDDFCLASLLNSYANAKPKQSQRAEAAFREFVTEHPEGVSPNTLAALGRAVGQTNADALCKKCGLDRQAIKAAGKGTYDTHQHHKAGGSRRAHQ